LEEARRRDPAIISAVSAKFKPAKPALGLTRVILVTFAAEPNPGTLRVFSKLAVWKNYPCRVAKPGDCRSGAFR
jgi:hypothetical protein